MRKVSSFSVLLLIASLTGCATQAQYTAMVPSNVQLVNHHADTVATSVSGGEKTNPLWTSEISSEGYRQALDQTLRESELFSGVSQGAGSDYQLTVRLNKAKQPMVGLGMTVRLSADWLLTRAADGQTVWQETVDSEYTAKFTEHVIGYERLRKANEGAVRENIRIGLERLSAVPFQNEIRLTGASSALPSQLQ
ncbi:hypothetical protein GC176_19910 [bacterium]|nr:hypothetical protein [bacterium]